MDQWLQRNRQPVTVAVVMGALNVVTVLVTYLWARAPAPAPIVIQSITPPASPSPHPTSVPEPITVYVVGSVIQPGVYTIPAGSRVAQALEAAGGAASSADLVRVNLAEWAVDGQQIYVPDQAEGTIPVLPTAIAGSGNRGIAAAAKKVNINTASAQELESLPGIGPAIATRILEYRTAQGPFRTTEELQKVKGIGEITFARLQDLIVVD
jgi:competence protein ComEA